MKKGFGIILIIGIIIIIAIVMIANYNGMVSKKELIENSSSNLDVMLQRRGDLIPNLANTVKGYTSHEKLLNQQKYSM